MTDIIFCKKCLTPNSRPRIVFDKNNICNACINAIEKKRISWKKREQEFLKIIDKIKKDKNKNQSYDCIVPWSGGKDSSSIAIKLKKYGLRPLLVTFSPLLINEIGSHNREILINKGFDSLFFRPDQNVAKKLAKRFFIERGNPKIAWDAGVMSIPVKMAINFNIPYIFYAEHGDSEYGGLVLKERSKKLRETEEVIEHIIGDYPQNWVTKDISLKDLYPYIYPDQNSLKKNKIKAYYFSYFFKWSMVENFDYIKKELPEFKIHSKGRTSGTFTNFDSLDDKIDDLYYYMQHIKFGFGRAVRDASRFIQNGKLSRDEGLILAKKYDGEFPKENFNLVLEYLGISENSFYEIVNKHRNEEIWKKKNNTWEINNPIQ